MRVNSANFPQDSNKVCGRTKYLVVPEMHYILQEKKRGPTNI